MANERKRFYTNSGSRIAEEHQVRIDENGHKTLVKTGKKINTYDIIQSHAEETKIENIIAKCEINGYPELTENDFGDMTTRPKSLIEATMILQDEENKFNSLSPEIRSKFNNSFTEYIATASKDIKTFAEKMGLVKKEIIEEIEETTPIKKEIKEDN